MKVAICLYPINDLGGIINHTEQLIAGFKGMGHEVDLLKLRWIKQHPRDEHKTLVNPIVGYSGYPYDQQSGWNFPAKSIVPYKDKKLKEARERLNTYDLIIWTIPNPTKQAANRGNHDWLGLYDLEHPKQVAVVHDGNIRSGNPFILAIQHCLDAVACVHPCALGGAAFLEVPRALILNPQDLSEVGGVSWAERKPGFFNAQTFKGWKHTHELIEAIAYMPLKREGELRMVAGAGIEQRYMQSKDKCRPSFFHPPGSPFAGHRFWQAALDNGMERPEGNWLTHEQVTHILSNEARCLVDPSWAKRYAKVGGHFNRVVVDAIRCGAIPAARRMGMGEEFFKPHVHYYPIDAEDPATYAEEVLAVGELPASRANEYRQAGQDLLPRFERKKIAQQMINLAFGESNDQLTVLHNGETAPSDKRECFIYMKDFFGKKDFTI